MTDLQVQNNAFRVELVKVFNAIFAEAAELIGNEPDELVQGYGMVKGSDFCKKLGTMITRVATMSNDATNEEREGIRLQTRTDFLDLIDVVKHYGLMAIYEAGDHV